MQSSEITLQQKQAYLRNNIHVDHYEDFYEFCERSLESVDINSWTMPQLTEIVTKFNQFLKEEAKNSNKGPQGQYNQYQSNSPDIKPDNDPEESEISECKTSRVIKSSAVELLDEILSQPVPAAKLQSKPAITHAEAPITRQPRPDNRRATSSVSFQDFQFWTSTASTNQQKNEPRNRGNSELLPNRASTQNPSTFGNQKNVSNINQFQTNNQNIQNNANNSSNLDAKKFQTQTHFSNDDFDIFANFAQKPKNSVPSSKDSPYRKKDLPQEPTEPPKRIIKLKEVRELNPNSRAISVDVGKLKQDAPFEVTLNCYKSTQRSQLSDRSLNIFIDKHEIIERKFLAADYAMYNVKIVPLGIECKRNYDDFYKLRTNLAKFYPGIHLPYLQETSWLSGTSLQFITNQKKMLELFARDLIRNKELRNSRVMQDFLTLKNHKEIKRKFEKYDQMEELKGLEELCLLDGKLSITINPEQKNYLENMEKFLQKMNGMFERHQKLTQALVDQYHDLMKTFKSLINLMDEMDKQIKEFNSKITVNTIKYLGHSVRILKQTYSEQLANMKFEHEINLKKVIPFLHYQKHNFLQLSKLIETEKRLHKAYQKRSLHEKIETGDTYNSQKQRGANKSILGESEQLIALKYQVGYFGHQARFQSQRVFDELAVKIVGKWKSLGESYLTKLISSVDFWKGLTNTELQNFRTQLTF